MIDEQALRAQLVKLLDYQEAHVGFDRAVKGIPARMRGAVPKGWEYSLWQLVEHLRIAQADILEFCATAKYKEKKWPDDYWPKAPAPKNAAAWTKALAAYRRDRRTFQRLAANGKIDLLAAIPHGTGQTYLREIILAADHAAYHIGQIVALRRQLGIWG
ncbi:MAG TPA: DinB family protein [Vicinamibacterales bacterium]|nr:DinB family protein [Vicinamibacterales bacterium]